MHTHTQRPVSAGEHFVSSFPVLDLQSCETATQAMCRGVSPDGGFYKPSRFNLACTRTCRGTQTNGEEEECATVMSQFLLLSEDGDVNEALLCRASQLGGGGSEGVSGCEHVLLQKERERGGADKGK